jgi:MFS family permease
VYADADGLTASRHRATLELFQSEIAPVLRHGSPPQTGLAFAVVGVAAFLGGVFGPRIIGRIGSRAALVTGLVLQSAGPAGLALVAGHGTSPVLVLSVLCVGAFGHVTAVVSDMVTGTSGLPDDEQGLATGLASMTQQVALAVGIPILSGVATARLHALETGHTAAEAVLGGVRLALGVDVAVLVLAAAVTALGLRAWSVRDVGEADDALDAQPHQ